MTEKMSGGKRTNWRIDYEAVEPIRMRDPVAEALAVLDPGEPFIIRYNDVVKAAGHSCPTAAGAYRIAQLGLDRLYSDALPVRSDIEVLAAGPKSDSAYGVMSRLISYITGAAEEDGFSGLIQGYGNRREFLSFDAFDAENADPTFRFCRTDRNETIEASYDTDKIPDAGPGLAYLSELIDESASEDERAAFRNDWHDRVRTILTTDDFFTVSRIDE